MDEALSCTSTGDVGGIHRANFDFKILSRDKMTFRALLFVYFPRTPRSRSTANIKGLLARHEASLLHDAERKSSPIMIFSEVANALPWKHIESSTCKQDLRRNVVDEALL